MIYPLRFTPIYKEKIWGGSKLKNLYNKDIPSDKTGESWEISGIRGNESIVENGFLKGKSLREIIQYYKTTLVGNKVYTNYSDEFPLLIKFIDANADLSIQVHPDDKTAAERCASSGKTEMWYICEADINANLIAGFKNKTSKERVIKNLELGKIEENLNYEKVEKNDSFYIPSNTVHSIGKGILLAEIQQSSDITYRIFDFNRKDKEGKLRDLHINEAADIMNYSGNDNCRIFQDEKPLKQLVNTEFFTTNVLNIKGQIKRDYKNIDSFIVYMCTEGEVELEYTNEEIIKIQMGGCILLPALFKEVKLNSKTNSRLLEIYI